MSEYHYDFKMWTHNGVIKVVSSDYETFPALQFTSRLIGVQVECSDGVFVSYEPVGNILEPGWRWIDDIAARWELTGMKVIKIGVHPVTMAELYNIAFFEGRIKDP